MSRVRKLTPAEKARVWQKPESNAGEGWEPRQPGGYRGERERFDPMDDEYQRGARRGRD